MGCSSCGGKGASALYNVEVTFRDGTKKVYGSKGEARIALSAAGGGGQMKQVLKKDYPVTQ
jgi:hypothetical protein